jgi:23S rRNA pseudouridine1911/1915/1917 synthase
VEYASKACAPGNNHHFNLNLLMLTAKDILYEDNHLIIVNKKPSEIVQGDETGDETLGDLVKAYLKAKYKKPGDVFLGITHRLDRPVSGAVIFARTSKALARLNEMLKERTITKVYWAVVKQRPPIEEGKLVHYLRKDNEKNKSHASDHVTKEGKRAELDYLLINQSDNYSLLEIRLYTGRHHQIRAQLAKIGCPIKGDQKYGYDRPNPDKSIHLHARMLEFIHPVSQKKITVMAPPPKEDLWSYFYNLIG